MASDAADAEQFEKASSLLTQLDSEASSYVPEVESARLIVQGRLLLEQNSLAYGAGGTSSERALELFEQAISLTRNHPKSTIQNAARLQRARALLSLGRGQNAIPDLLVLVKLQPNSAEVNAALGIAYISVGRTASSLAPLERAVELDPQEAERFIVLGTARMLLGDLKQAERSFRGALALDGSSARAHGDLGTVLLVQGQIKQGREHLKRASQLEPTRATYSSNLSYAELLSSEPEAALKWANIAIKLDATLASAWLNLGLAQVALEDRGGARLSFEKARDLDRSDPRPINNLKDLDELEAK